MLDKINTKLAEYFADSRNPEMPKYLYMDEDSAEALVRECGIGLGYVRGLVYLGMEVVVAWQYEEFLEVGN